MSGKEKHLLSIIKGLEGYDAECELSEFTECLSAEQTHPGWVLWEQDRDVQSEYGLSFHDSNSTCHQTQVKEKIKGLLMKCEKFHKWWRSWPSMIQFWAAKAEEGGHGYLTISGQPFFVDSLSKGCCWYRNCCRNHYYVVKEGAGEDQLMGPVARVNRNKHPESTPDLRLYSTTDFPLRDYGAQSGFRGYLALPLFDLHNNECYGVLELLSTAGEIAVLEIEALYAALQVQGLRSTHTNFQSVPNHLNFELHEEKGEITKMLELVIEKVPELHLAQIWIPCKQCANHNSNLRCFERENFIIPNLYSVFCLPNKDYDMYCYLKACELHNLQIGRALMASDGKSCFIKNICDMSISENPLAHYAQKSRLSLCFALPFQSVHDSNDLCLVEFYLKSNCRDNENSNRSPLRLLLRILMEIELKSYRFSLAEDLVAESGQPNVFQFAQETNHLFSEEINMSRPMERDQVFHSESDFKKSLQTVDLCFKQCKSGHLVCSLSREELFEKGVNSSSSLALDPIKNKLTLSMEELASQYFAGSYLLVQFWAPKMEDDRCYLTILDQPFALGNLHRGLAFYRKKCMEHHYFVDERAKEEELGPPGRVFRNGLPEITPDLRLYSTREFSLRNNAALSCLRKYLALPVFDLALRKCVGVLELVAGRDITSSGLIEDALKATNLTATRSSFKPSFLANLTLSGFAESRKLALTELENALEMIVDIPQLYIAQVWVPYDDSNISCMERLLSTGEIDCFEEDTTRLQTRKGISKLVLESENKSCFCRSSSDYSITEQSRAHYEQRKRMDVCFAICLQSSHTGDLPYVLEFFLIQGPETYDHLSSFLEFLLPVMKQELKSFKVASGKQIGEKLAVDIIAFSEADKLAYSELKQPDKFQVEVKLVQYGREEHQQANDSVTSVSQEQRRCPGASSFKKSDDMSNKTARKNRKGSLNITLEDLKPHFGRKLDDVVKGLHDSLPNTQTSSNSNLPVSDIHLRQNVPQTNTESTLHPTSQAEAEWAVVKVKGGDGTIKFDFCLSSGINRLLEEVSMKLKLNKGSFNLKYVDEDNDEIILACDDDLQNCPKSLTATGKNCISLFVQLISNTKCAQIASVGAEAEGVIVKVKVADGTIKLNFCLSLGLDRLLDEVAMKLKTEKGSFKLKYVDEDSDEIILTCDADLQECPKRFTTSGKTLVRLLI